MQTLKKKIVFIDADGKRARLDVEVTNRNGYPEFTMSGQYTGGYGQVIDRIKPANDAQRELIDLHRDYHLKDVSSVANFDTNLVALCARIEEAENARPDKNLAGDDATLAIMAEEGIDDSMLDAVNAYIELTDSDDLKDFEDAYAGEFSNNEEFAQDMAENIGAIENDTKWPYTCIDWEQAGRELMNDYSEQDGYYFRSL